MTILDTISGGVPDQSNGKLLDRKIDLTIGTLEVSTELNIRFSVKKSIKPEPNTCDLQIYNLSPKSRKALETAKKQPVRLLAGYASGVGQLYLGDVRQAWSHTEGSDVITELTTGDSEKNVQQSRITQPFGPATDAGTVLRTVAAALGVGMGNIEETITTLHAKGFATYNPRSFIISGNVAQELNDLCNAANLSWSVQDGKLQFLDLGRSLAHKAVSLTPESGLVGSPSVDSKGVLTATALLIPDIRPGVKVYVEAKSLKGFYTVTHVEYVGETRGKDWYAKFTGAVITT